METIVYRPGYRSVYGEVSKWVAEASVFIQSASESRDGVGGKAN
jgi:hypothetical protein